VLLAPETGGARTPGEGDYGRTMRRKSDGGYGPAAPRVRRSSWAEIRARAGTLDDSDVDGARVLGELLTAHVRFEERVLFALLERALDDERLAALGAAVEAAEHP
jgi:hypothetical protein